ncbi:hypothetical protein CH372_18450 [Leptospira meyeri]|uniref:hypothetical protein n=1 Tax=Leptospira meyeri TaxID=29508 RepID=UPI000C2AC99D|nr:hypothetical protein [Leptospira meyeri]PKA10623.1 hypothetical protein CH372_18450 [Leptospira meyeri]PKA23940.1 hypothetical protein CH381_23060 [Leptospira sp. mixed culture ATI2-C-A1]
MKENNIKIEAEKIHELAKEYTKKGYKVYLEPNNKDLPKFLKDTNYRPDLIVKSKKENLVIEVKSSKSLSELNKFKDIPNLFKNKKNWEFLLVVTNPKNPVSQKLESNSFQEETIVKSFEKIQILRNNTENFDDVISLYLWSILESILRFGLSKNNYTSNTQNFKSILRDSHIHGLISKRDFSILFDFQSLRNKLSHGDLETDIESNKLTNALNVSKRIFNEIRNEYIHKNNIPYIYFLRNLTKSELETEIENLVSETIYDLINEDEMSEIIASTNSYDWNIDNFNITEISFKENECNATINFHASGEQHEDQMHAGSEILGNCIAIIDSSKNVKFEIIKLEKE